MSTMKFNRKPPLPRSPVRQRPRRVLRSSSTNTAQTPPGSLAKSKKLNLAMEEPEYSTVSRELMYLATLVNEEIGDKGISDGIARTSSPLFERGRFYDVYSVRRNERLKRKKEGDFGGEAKTPYNLGVVADSCKKRDSKKFGSLRKSVTASYSVEISESTLTAPRYSLRSLSKENKKPPMGNFSYERSAIATERKIGVSRGRKI